MGKNSKKGKNMKTIIGIICAVLIVTGCQTTTARKESPIDLERPVQETSSTQILEEANAAFSQDNFDQAVELYTQWLAEHSDDEVALVNRGRAQAQRQEYEAALEDFQAAKTTIALIHAGRVYLIQNKVKPAKNMIDQALNKDDFQKLDASKKYMAYYLDGQIKNMLEQYEEALLALNQALEIFNTSPGSFKKQGIQNIQRFAIYHKALALHYLNKNKDVPELMEQYIALTKEAGDEVTSHDYKSLALAYYLANNIDKCKAILPEVDPADRAALHAQFGDSFFLAN